ncbi:hypothetical protein [Streptomyces sp. NPDC055506]
MPAADAGHEAELREPRWSGTVATRAKEIEQGNWGAAAVHSAVIQTAASFSTAGAAAVVTTLS